MKRSRSELKQKLIRSRGGLVSRVFRIGRSDVILAPSDGKMSATQSLEKLNGRAQRADGRMYSTDTIIENRIDAIETGIRDAIRISAIRKSPARKGRNLSRANKEARRQVIRGRFARVTGALFFVIIAAFFVAGFFIPDKSFSASENRLLQEKPRFSVSDFFEGRLEKHLEDYFNDQFPMRESFIKVKAAMDVTGGKLESNGVYRIKNDYLVEEIKLPDPQKLKEVEAALQQFKSRYPEMDMYFMLVPNAANVLSDKLPLTLRMNDQNAAINDFYDQIEVYGYYTIDVRDAFNRAKRNTPLYYKTDHHWTTDGAYVAYQVAADVMDLGPTLEYKPYVVKNDFSGTLYSKSGYTNGVYDQIKLYLPEDKTKFKDSVMYYPDSKERTTEFYQVDNLQKKDAYTVFGGSNHPMYTIKTPVESKRRLLLVKDSYANSFIPFLSQHFREIVVVDPRYFFENLDDLMATEGVTEVLFLYNGNTFFTDDSLALTLVERGGN